MTYIILFKFILFWRKIYNLWQYSNTVPFRTKNAKEGFGFLIGIIWTCFWYKSFDEFLGLDWSRGPLPLREPPALPRGPHPAGGSLASRTSVYDRLEPLLINGEWTPVGFYLFYLWWSPSVNLCATFGRIGSWTPGPFLPDPLAGDFLSDTGRMAHLLSFSSLE